MNDTQLAFPSDPATLMVADRVAPERVDDYERWLGNIHGDLKRQPGFLTVDVIRHPDMPQPEYTILVKFDSPENLARWRRSKTLAHWMKALKSIVARPPHLTEAVGLELWFERSTGAKMRLPPYWKRVVLSIGCVYPMIILLSWALSPIIGKLPQAAQIFVVVMLLSTLLTYPIMPFVSRLLRGWLNR